MERENLEVINKASWLITCPNCSAVNNDLAEFCYKCNNKFGTNLDPMGIIYDEGALLRNVAHKKPKFIVLLGTWLIFLPLVISGFLLSLDQILYESGTNGFLFFWLGVAMVFVSLFFLYNVTRNYFTMKEKKFNQN